VAYQRLLREIVEVVGGGMPVISGGEAVQAFRTMGYATDLQRRSHIILREPQFLTGA
jgi:hypothetical protein